MCGAYVRVRACAYINSLIWFKPRSSASSAGIVPASGPTDFRLLRLSDNDVLFGANVCKVGVGGGGVG